jgi:hypothetical protein
MRADLVRGLPDGVLAAGRVSTAILLAASVDLCGQRFQRILHSDTSRPSP